MVKLQNSNSVVRNNQHCVCCHSDETFNEQWNRVHMLDHVLHCGLSNVNTASTLCFKVLVNKFFFMKFMDCNRIAALN